MGKINSYKDLQVWQKAMDLVDLIYTATRSFPKDELYGLTNQLRRAAVSVPSNIAEGRSRQSKLEYRQFISIARGSLAEIETQLIIAQRQGYLTEDTVKIIMELHDEVGKMTTTMFKTLSS
ncbi:MAG: four helix bundle protein [Candidatus Hydrogenedens sp.]|jgi:four helix bundle protein|nr:four helix bundle protein [Candidatus Hydrogenedens sp.]